METLFKDKVFGVLGIGNLLLGDEGFGVHCVQKLEAQYEVPENVRIFDGGTAGILLAPFVEECDYLFVLDVVALDGEPGSVHLFTEEDVRSGGIQMRMSPHQIGMLEILDICKVNGRAPEKINFYTVIPLDISPGMKLSPLVEGRVKEVLEALFFALGQFSIVLSSKE